MSGSSSHITYPLATIWVEPMQDTENAQIKVLHSSKSIASRSHMIDLYFCPFLIKNGLSLTMPEESLALACPTSAEKIEWLVALQSAIRQALLSDDVGLSSNGRTTPPLVRSASYTFTKLPQLKDVTYKGTEF